MSNSRCRPRAAGSGSISASPICAPANSWPPRPSFPTRRGRFSSPATSISSCKGAKPAFTASLPISSAGSSGATEEIGFLHFALTERVFISSRRHQLNAIEATRKALRLGAKVQSPAALLELIAGQMIESLDHFADGLADQLDRAEERILADELNVDRKVVGSVRRTTVRLHRQLVTLRSLIQRFEHEIEEVARIRPSICGRRSSFSASIGSTPRSSSCAIAPGSCRRRSCSRAASRPIAACMCSRS